MFRYFCEEKSCFDTKTLTLNTVYWTPWDDWNLQRPQRKQLVLTFVTIWWQCELINSCTHFPTVVGMVRLIWFGNFQVLNAFFATLPQYEKKSTALTTLVWDGRPKMADLPHGLRDFVLRVKTTANMKNHPSKTGYHEARNKNTSTEKRVRVQLDNCQVGCKNRDRLKNNRCSEFRRGQLKKWFCLDKKHWTNETRKAEGKHIAIVWCWHPDGRGRVEESVSRCESEAGRKKEGRGGESVYMDSF